MNIFPGEMVSGKVLNHESREISLAVISRRPKKLATDGHGFTRMGWMLHEAIRVSSVKSVALFLVVEAVRFSFLTI
jgi:hypothetical protein